ncbi:putative sulfate/molybdate transporter [Candidatus Zixiibacteriota bacterium]
MPPIACHRSVGEMQGFRAEHRNAFTLSEWAGAVGDLGILLPFAFALVIFNEFPPERLLFLWGLTYIVTGWYYRVPVSVQPLKAMAVIAIAAGFGVPELASTAIFFGTLMIILSVTGVIGILQRFFSISLIRGIQMGLGFILFQTSVTMITGRGLILGTEDVNLLLNLLLTLFTVLFIVIIQKKLKLPAGLIVIMLSVVIAYSYGAQTMSYMSYKGLIDPTLPRLGFLGTALVVLMIPQLPLTLGNAVYAASDACCTFWPDRSERATPARLGLSIGLSNIAIGLSGGFPICHGAGGIAAHARFGGTTGGTTMILGVILLVAALIRPLSDLLFAIPIPVLGALLILTSWKLIVLVRDLKRTLEIITASAVGLLSFITRNITIALVAGFLIERGLLLAHDRFNLFRGEEA